MEPYESRMINSMIDQNFKNTDFIEDTFAVNNVNPEKTMLEKMILLHEEFQKPKQKIRFRRMSRHLYDIIKISKTDYGIKAMKNTNLFEKICSHRAKFTPVKTVNYFELKVEDLMLVPPQEFRELYEKDYREMQDSMIYGESPKFNELINYLENLTNI
jgi:hypothetical protein